MAYMRFCLQRGLGTFYLTWAEPGNQEGITDKIVNVFIGESSKILFREITPVDKNGSCDLILKKKISFEMFSFQLQILSSKHVIRAH